MTEGEVFIRRVVDLKWNLGTFVEGNHSFWVRCTACSLKQRHINESSLIKPPSIDICSEFVSVVGHDLFNVRLFQILPTIRIWITIRICHICTPSVECWRAHGCSVIIVSKLKSVGITFVDVILQLQERWACVHVVVSNGNREELHRQPLSNEVNAPCPAMYTMTFNPTPWMASRSSLNRSLPVGPGVASVLLRLHKSGWCDK